MNSSNNHESRRPLKVRDANIAQNFARWLAQKNVQPNHISLFSIVFGLAATACLLSFSQLSSAGWQSASWAVLAALAIQGRLLCNLFDGMVAVEGGKSTASGELFNDIPDRVVDPMIMVGLGYAATQFDVNSTLGWLAAVLAVMTAYVRTLAASIGAPVDFSGPMAKQHRMALATIACVLVAFEVMFTQTTWSLSLALWLIVAGCAVTIGRRAYRAYHYLENNQSDKGV